MSVGEILVSCRIHMNEEIVEMIGRMLVRRYFSFVRTILQKGVSSSTARSSEIGRVP